MPRRIIPPGSQRSDAQHHLHFESYIFHEDNTGREFPGGLIAKVRQGVAVRLIYDSMGGFGKTSRHFWNRLRAAGVDVRCDNAPRWESPLGWLSRDHRKMLAVDGQVGFIAGLGVGQMWVGDPKRKIDPWRAIGVRGPAVAAIEKAFAEVWAMLGSGIPATDFIPQDALSPAAVRFVFDLLHNPSSCSLGPRVSFISVLDDQTHASRLRTQLGRQFHVTIRHFFIHRAQHDHAAAERQFGMHDTVAGTVISSMFFESEYAAEPFHGIRRVT